MHADSPWISYPRMGLHTRRRSPVCADQFFTYHTYTVVSPEACAVNPTTNHRPLRRNNPWMASSTARLPRGPGRTWRRWEWESPRTPRTSADSSDANTEKESRCYPSISLSFKRRLPSVSLSQVAYNFLSGYPKPNVMEDILPYSTRHLYAQVSCYKFFSHVRPTSPESGVGHV